jgi:uncharacterized membrane protein YbhN (UPF0104 family)
VKEAKHLNRFVKTALGLVLLAVLLSQLQLSEMLAKIKSADWMWALLGLVLASFANLACGLRWRKIVIELGQPLEKMAALKLYFQGITANTVLPGGIIGGDIWRVLGLSKLGMSKISAVQSVVIDRAVGFWALSSFALLAFCIQLMLGQMPSSQAPQNLMLIYLFLLIGISLLPAFLCWIKVKWVRGMFLSSVIAAASQIFTISSFLCCLKAFEADFNSLAVITLCAGIFLGSVIPASIGGFGSREVVSILFLAGLGIQAEVAFLASVLFGLTEIAQCLFTLPFWLASEDSRLSQVLHRHNHTQG